MRNPEKSQGESSDRPLRAIFLRLVGAFFLAALGAIAKLADARGANLAEIVFFRQAFAVPVALLWVVSGPGLASLKTKHAGAHLLRVMVGLTGLTATLQAVILLPLAEATTLQFTAPIFATVLAILLLGERPGLHRLGAILFGFLGVLVMMNPGSTTVTLAPFLIGLVSALLMAVVAILLRRMGRTEPAATTAFWFAALSLLPVTIVYCFYVQPHDLLTWIILASGGIVGGIAQLAFTAALRFAPVSVITPVDYSGLIWSAALGWLLFGALPGSATWLGAALIIAGGLCMTGFEHAATRRRRAALRP